MSFWARGAREALRNETQFTTKGVDVLAGPDCVSWVGRIAVQLLDMVPDCRAYLVGESEIAEWRSPWIKVLCD